MKILIKSGGTASYEEVEALRLVNETTYQAVDYNSKTFLIDTENLLYACESTTTVHEPHMVSNLLFWKCDDCGYTDVAQHATYCEECGKRITNTDIYESDLKEVK